MTDLSEFNDLHHLIRPVCEAAGDAIAYHFHRQSELTIKHKDDASPVTEADLAAHKLIQAGLARLPWQLPLVSEEGEVQDADERLSWQTYWLVDPLDGTREFLAGSSEFTVNIALVDNHRSVWGAIYQPIGRHFYWGGKAFGAWSDAGPLHAQSSNGLKPPALRMIGSKRHGLQQLELWQAKAKSILSPGSLSVGSSLKFCAIAAGRADFYPRFGPTSEWDTAAGQAILEGAGGQVVDATGAPLRYNTKTSLLNPEFVALNSASSILLDRARPECLLHFLRG